MTTSTTPAPTGPTAPSAAAEPSSIVSVKPVVLPAPGRGADLEVRVSAPVQGQDLPVVVLAHGFGGAMNGYDPLVDHWAARGFVVVQPTFLDSATLGIAADDPRTPEIWRWRIRDVQRVLDHLEEVLGAIPGLPARVDPARIAVAGHSWGAQTVGTLLGARVLGDDGLPGESWHDPRVTAGVLFAATGTGGDDLSPFAREHFAFMSPDFGSLTTPTLVVAGDHDQSLLTATRGPDWFTDVHRLAPGAEALLTLHGGEHTLGGIHAYRSADTTDEDPARVDLIRRTTTAWLQHALGVDDAPWQRLRDETDPAGRLEAA